MSLLEVGRKIPREGKQFPDSTSREQRYVSLQATSHCALSRIPGSRKQLRALKSELLLSSVLSTFMLIGVRLAHTCIKIGIIFAPCFSFLPSQNSGWWFDYQEDMIFFFLCTPS